MGRCASVWVGVNFYGSMWVDVSFLWVGKNFFIGRCGLVRTFYGSVCVSGNFSWVGFGWCEILWVDVGRCEQQQRVPLPTTFTIFIDGNIQKYWYLEPTVHVVILQIQKGSI